VRRHTLMVVFVVCLSALAAAALVGCETSDTPGGGANSPGGGMMNGASPSSSPGGGMMNGASPSSSPGGGMMNGASPNSSPGGGMMNGASPNSSPGGGMMNTGGSAANGSCSAGERIYLTGVGPDGQASSRTTQRAS